MRSTWHRYLLVSSCIVLIALQAIAAREQQLAGIKLGQSKASVVAALGFPHGKILPVPPLENLAASGSNKTTTAPTDKQALIESLVFIDYTKGASETPLSDVSGNNKPVTVTNTVITGPPTGTPTAAAARRGKAAPQVAKIPVWAYMVRVNALTIDQEQLIYKISTSGSYAIGVTLTKRNGDFVVTDIVACSFDPLWKDPKDPKKKKTVDTYYRAKRKYVPAKTAQGIHLGSRYADVLRSKYGWPQYCFPYAAPEITRIVDGVGRDVPVNASGSKAGLYPVKITDGASESVNGSFTRDMLILYPNAGIALTLVDLTVVRINLGQSVIEPKPTTTDAGTSGSSSTPGTGAGGNEDSWW